jgi:3',5'-cyclic AMP phosphodiesterase CpdA
MTLRFLHLSDIHFGQEKNGARVTHDNVRNALVRDARELTKKRGRATRILITGDVAYSGKQKEYDAAADWLEKLTQACQCEQETHVCPIPGNHDCDLDAITGNAGGSEQAF